MAFKKIFKPVAKVLDKIIPNEIKPALPYLAAFAPVFGPTSGMFGSTMMKRALLSGGANVLAQLSQEGSEGDVNLLSAGLGALTGAMTVPGVEGGKAIGVDKFGNEIISRGVPSSAEIFRGGAKKIGEDTLRGKGLEFLAKGSDIFAAGAADPFSTAGLKAATLPAAVATGDVMQAQARQLEKEEARQAALAEAEALADSGARADAIRNAMRAYGFFTDEEIEETISSAGYRAGGRVGFRFGGIDEAIDKIETEKITKLLEPDKGGLDSIKDKMAGMGNVMKLFETPFGFDRGMFEDMLIQYEDSGAKTNGIKLYDFAIEFIGEPLSKKPMPKSDRTMAKEGGRVGLQEGGVLAQILPQANQITIRPGFQPFLGRPGFAPTLQQAEAVFPRLNQLERGVNIAEQDLGRIRERLGNQPRQFISASQGPIGLQQTPATNMLSIAQLANRGDVPQGMKEGGLMNLGGKEMDLRGGGFVPIGKKERADDVPARLSKNEFVMTADAVRAAGGGSVNKGAKRMYDLMNTLEARA
jgi:hypothetical protein